MESVSYKIKIRASVNGVEKIPSKIAWIQGNDECLLTPCYKENDYLIVELIPGCVGNACIEGWLIFDDTCSNCEPIHFKRCFCSNNEDCEDCEDCNEQGICQSKCLEGEYCLNDACVECDPNNPCPNGKICINGRCVCPQGYFEKDGRCIQCDETTILNKCQECKNGLIVDKPCAGVCDPPTGDCVDCLTSGDCFNRTDGKNCCNPDTKACECCPGTTWSAEQGKCIPILCTSDEECGDPCLKCTIDGCQPMICPPGMKCWKGECVDWPCINTSCENGADCGPDCGCIEIDGVKQCVPCAVLECSGMCEQALGCKCKDNDVCGPVDNCNDYCDGETACADPNCTCYNNRCVSCENFPCDFDDCSSRPNCGCSGGDCSGGQGCKDKLELIKACGDNKSDCKLTAKLTLEKPCKCDDIRFETNLVSCNAQNTIRLKVNLFKGQIPYNDFTNLAIGDNELVEGIISTKVTHYNQKGDIITVGQNAISDKSIILNSVQEIDVIRPNHYKTNYKESLTSNPPTKVKIEVIAKNVKIPNNNCINYKNETVIATYNLNFADITENQICTVINNSIGLQKAYINDKISIKKPLFVWSKSATDFPISPYTLNGDYNSKGWFRKEYGVKTATGWEDVLSTVDQGLVNNYNYVVKTDCGCTNISIHNKLDFCCLPDITPNLQNCNTKLQLPSFKVCEINGKIQDSAVSDFNKAYYRLKIVHDGRDIVTKDITFNADGINTLPLNYEDLSKGIITSLRVERYFKGGLLENDICFKDLPVSAVNLPEVIYTYNCDIENFKYTVTLNQVASGLKVLGAFFVKETLDRTASQSSFAQTITMGNSAQKSIDIPIKNNGIGFVDFSTERLIMTVTFEGGCSKKYDLTSCEKDMTLTSNPDIYSGRACTNPTQGPTIEVNTFGFSSNVQYSLNNGAYQTSNQFPDVEPGTYIVKAKEIINGVEVVLEDVITIQPKMPTQVNFTPNTLCAGGTAALNIISDPGSSFTIKAPSGAILTSNAVTDALGRYTYPNLSIGGEYTITNNVANAKYCNTDIKLMLSVGGETLNPVITLQQGSYCVGQPIPFRIFDNGSYRTYNVVTTNGSVTSPLQAIDSGFNGEYIPSSPNGSIIIQSSTSTCDRMTPVTISTPTSGVTITTGPVIGTPNVSCVSGLHTVSVNITGATTVTIGGVTITPVGTTYTRTGITGTSSLEIVASNGACSIITPIIFPNCDCPHYEASIAITPGTCGQGSQQISIPTSSTNLIGTTYSLQKFNYGLGFWSDVPGFDSVGTPYSDIFTLPAPLLNVDNQLNNPETYRFLFTDSANCTYETNFVTTSGTFEPTITINSSIQNNVSLGSTVQLTAYGGVPGTTTYSWTGFNVTGQTTQTVTIPFTAAGTYEYSVTATTGSCLSTVLYTVIVDPGCLSPITANIAETYNSACQVFTASAIGGSGAITYEWLVDGNIVYTGIVYNGQGISLGSTKLVTLRASSNGGLCVSEISRSYTMCSCRIGGQSIPDVHSYNSGTGNITIGSVSIGILAPDSVTVDQITNYSVSYSTGETFDLTADVIITSIVDIGANPLQNIALRAIPSTSIVVPAYTVSGSDNSETTSVTILFTDGSTCTTSGGGRLCFEVPGFTCQ